MSKYTAFPNPPITEAVLNIELELSKDFDLKSFDAFYDKIKENFPKKQEHVSHKIGLTVSSSDIASSAESKPDGYLFSSIEGDKIIQTRLNGFSFHKLKPYQNWDIFSSEAQEVWNKYVDIIKPFIITRISLRYINRIEIPLPLLDIGEYLLTIPPPPPKMALKLQGFFTQTIVRNDVDQSIIGVIAQTIAPPDIQQKLPLILDIGVTKERVYNEDNIVEIWQNFKDLREFKNDIFFNSITDKAKELFQ